jgi:hypothetical protein
MSLDAMASADLAQISRVVLERQGQFIFTLISVLLKGVSTLYYRKTTLLLESCEVVIARISLKFQPDAPAQPAPATRSHDGVEIDQETLDLWRQENNLESLIAAETATGADFSGTKAKYEPQRHPLTIVDDSPPNVEIPQDFGDVAFILNGTEYPDLDLPPPPDFSDTDGDEPERFVKSDPSDPEENPAYPFMTMQQYIRMLEDPSQTLCERPCNRILRTATESGQLAPQLDGLYILARTIGKRTIGLGDEDGEVPPIPEDYPEDIVMLNSSENEEAEEIEIEESNKEHVASLVMPVLAGLKETSVLGFGNVVKGYTRREIAMTFHGLLGMHNSGRVVMSQADGGIEICSGPRPSR